MCDDDWTTTAVFTKGGNICIQQPMLNTYIEERYYIYAWIFGMNANVRINFVVNVMMEYTTHTHCQPKIDWQMDE